MLESNLMIMLSAHAFASFGFGLSLLAMWLRWFASTAVFKASLVRFGKSNNAAHHCASPSLATTPRAAIHFTLSSTPLQHDSIPAPSEVAPRQPPARHLPPQHTELRSPVLPLITSSDSSSAASESSDSTPAESLSLPMTPVPIADLPLDLPERDKVLRRRSNSTSSLLLKVKAPFRAKDKRLSLPGVLPEQAKPLLPMNKTTRMAMAASTSKTKRAKTLWHLSRGSSSTTTSRAEQSCDSKPSRRNFLGFHRRSNTATHTDSRSARKTAHPVKPLRTLPYEAPYFANPPAPLLERHFRIQPSPERNCSG